MTIREIVPAKVTEFVVARRVAQLIHKIQKRYIGKRVVELMPSGAEWEGVIEKMEWEPSLCNIDENGEYCEGGWSVFVKYDAGFGSWTSDKVLRLV